MMGKVRAAAAIAALLMMPPLAAAQSGQSLTSKVELEKTVAATDGQPAAKTYVAPDVVIPGDRVRITLNFANGGAAPASGVKIDNPIPKGLVFDGTADPAGFSVSVDGAKTFGALATLTVPVSGAAPRAATNADVTHVRWLWSDAIAPGRTRSVAFFAKVK